MRTKSLLCGCIVLLLMVVTMATPCFAADNTIYGCVRGFTGILRIVSPPGHCLPGESPISWNQTGPQGPQGQQGPKGDTGPMGPAGPAGVVNAVHGVVLYSGDPAPESVGFTSKYDGGVYYITFDPPLSGTPDCVISILASPDAFCAIVGYGPSILDVTCATPTIVNPNVLGYISPFQIPFSFICISEPL